MKIWLHSIDQKSGSAKKESISKNPDVKNFVERFAKNIAISKRSCEYKFSDSAKIVRDSVLKARSGPDFDGSADKVASNLAKVERRTAERFKHFKEIQEGSLLQAYFFEDGKEYCLIAKVDLLQILDKTTHTYKEGLPVERSVMKACLFTFDPKGIFKRIQLCDSNASIADYWSIDFLEMEPVRTRTSNTKSVFAEVEKVLVRQIKKKSLSDFRYLRRGLLDYLRTKKEIIYKDLLDSLLASYSPENAEIDTANLRETLDELPEKYGFDTQFKSDREALSKKRQMNFELSPNIDLVVKDEALIDDVISPFDENGRKGIKIVTAGGYDFFKARADSQKESTNDLSASD